MRTNNIVVWNVVAALVRCAYDVYKTAFKNTFARHWWYIYIENLCLYILC